jgi:hypothetical protein
MTLKTRLIAPLTASAVLIGTAALAAPAIDGGKRYTVHMTGAAECTNAGVCNQGDPDGSGIAVITVNRGQQRVCWQIDVTGVDPIAAAHIHLGFAGRAFSNNIVVPLDADQGCTEVTDMALLDALMQAPQAFYVNVHNATYPAGALRGQLG